MVPFDREFDLLSSANGEAVPLESRWTCLHDKGLLASTSELEKTESIGLERDVFIR